MIGPAWGQYIVGYWQGMSHASPLHQPRAAEWEYDRQLGSVIFVGDMVTSCHDG
eukprot:COSAG01_NODE_5125_length_4470_cov_2.390300_6_plen_54_part_00